MTSVCVCVCVCVYEAENILKYIHIGKESVFVCERCCNLRLTPVGYVCMCVCVCACVCVCVCVSERGNEQVCLTSATMKIRAGG